MNVISFLFPVQVALVQAVQVRALHPPHLVQAVPVLVLHPPPPGKLIIILFSTSFLFFAVPVALVQAVPAQALHPPPPGNFSNSWK